MTSPATANTTRTTPQATTTPVTTAKDAGATHRRRGWAPTPQCGTSGNVGAAYHAGAVAR